MRDLKLELLEQLHHVLRTAAACARDQQRPDSAVARLLIARRGAESGAGEARRSAVRLELGRLDNQRAVSGRRERITIRSHS